MQPARNLSVFVLIGMTPQPAGDEQQPGHEQGQDDAAQTQPAMNGQKDGDHDYAAGSEEHAPFGTGSAEEDHDHATHEHGSGPRWLNWLGRFHPPMTTFPIGDLIAGAVAEALLLISRRPEFDHVARYCVAFAAVSGIVAGILGWFFAGIRFTDPEALLGIHRWLGTVTVLWLIVLFWVSERARRPAQAWAKGWYHFLLFAGTALVLTTGFFGGSMVYGLDHFARS
ncbi:MAG: hypothetical protein IT430_01760 [Phycisphaerales bacterium]|nr:hypothetical protein [Phycisphaerales bacterium]